MQESCVNFATLFIFIYIIQFWNAVFTRFAAVPDYRETSDEEYPIESEGEEQGVRFAWIDPPGVGSQGRLRDVEAEHRWANCFSLFKIVDWISNSFFFFSRMKIPAVRGSRGWRIRKRMGRGEEEEREEEEEGSRATGIKSRAPRRRREEGAIIKWPRSPGRNSWAVRFSSSASYVSKWTSIGICSKSFTRYAWILGGIFDRLENETVVSLCSAGWVDGAVGLRAVAHSERRQYTEKSVEARPRRDAKIDR